MPRGQHLLIPDPHTGQSPRDRATLNSARSRRVRTLLRLLAELPSVTRDQRQQIIEAAISLSVLENQ